MITFEDQFGITIQLDNPKLADTDTLNFKRVNRETRGNDLIIADVGHFTTELIRFEWEYMSEEKCAELRGFLRRNVGLPVTLTDHYAVEREVIYLRPDTEISQIGRENRTAILDMQVL
jgi:hypothetical protein